jgi:hypothetical protein
MEIGRKADARILVITWESRLLLIVRLNG